MRIDYAVFREERVIMEQFIDAVLLRLDVTNHFSAHQLTTVRESLRAVGELYDIKPKGNEVMNYDILSTEGYKAYLVIKQLMI